MFEIHKCSPRWESNPCQSSDRAPKIVKDFKAIAAMSENRVIGAGNKIPWRLPDDFQWFKEMTSGQIVVMGRKTFESLPKPLANRKCLILTRHPRRLIRARPDVFGKYKEWRGGAKLKRRYQMRFAKLDGTPIEDIRLCMSLDRLNPSDFENDIYICGGAEIYQQALPRCSDLYLTLVKGQVEGDAFFPPFEEKFELAAVIKERPEFTIKHYVHR